MPLAKLEARVESGRANVLLKKNPVALKATKDAVRRVGEMTYDNAEDYLMRAQEAANCFDNDGRKEGIRQFIDDKTYKPGLGATTSPNRATGPDDGRHERTAEAERCGEAPAAAFGRRGRRLSHARGLGRFGHCESGAPGISGRYPSHQPQSRTDRGAGRA